MKVGDKVIVKKIRDQGRPLSSWEKSVIGSVGTIIEIFDDWELYFAKIKHDTAIKYINQFNNREVEAQIDSFYKEELELYVEEMLWEL